MNKEKMVRLAGKLDKLFRFFQKLILICAVVVVAVLLVLTAVHLIDPNSVIGENFEVLDLGPVTLELAEEYAPDNRTVLVQAWIGIVFGVAAAAVMYHACKCIRSVLQPMSQGEPFSASVTGAFRKLAYDSLIYGVLSNATGIVETVSVLRNWGLDRLVDGQQIASVTINYEIELGFLVVFFLLLLMDYIFYYGQELQQLSDETL